MPEAKMTRFSVAFIASSNVHSAFVDGLERGKTIGCLFIVAIRESTSLEKAPGIDERPIKLVRWKIQKCQVSI